jgi:hypothetical protein
MGGGRELCRGGRAVRGPAPGMEPRGALGRITEMFAELGGAGRDVIAPARADTHIHSAAIDARPGMAARLHNSATAPETHSHTLVRACSATPFRTRPGATATVVDPDSAGIPETHSHGGVPPRVRPNPHAHPSGPVHIHPSPAGTRTARCPGAPSDLVSHARPRTPVRGRAPAHSDIAPNVSGLVAGGRMRAHNDPRGKDRLRGVHTSLEEVVLHRASLSLGSNVPAVPRGPVIIRKPYL